MRPITTLTDYEKNRVAGDIFHAGTGNRLERTFLVDFLNKAKHD